MRNSTLEKIAVKRHIPKDFQAAEAVKTLRTNLMFSGADVKAVALTSFVASEGKSTVSFQLAASLAQAGKRVLLLDADLRKSTLVNRLRVRSKVEGLSHYLSGMANVNDLLYETDLPGMYIMFAGTYVPNSAELLGSAGFGSLITALKDVFDYVIVDCAPLGQVIDCAVIAPTLDGVLMVVDVNNNSYKMERRVKAQLEKSGARVLGVVLNRVNMKERGSYYGKIYGSYYGHHHDQPTGKDGES